MLTLFCLPIVETCEPMFWMGLNVHRYIFDVLQYFDV